VVLNTFVAIMIIYTSSYIYLFFFKAIFYFNIFFIILSTSLIVTNNLYGNVATFKDLNIANSLKNMLLSSLITNAFIVSLLLYTVLFLYKNSYFTFLIYGSKTNVLYNQFSYYFYQFDFDIFNIIFYILSLVVAFISLLALDTRIYSSKTIFLVLCNVLVLFIFLFSFTTNYVLFFIFYELLLIPSFFFVYGISPAKTSIQLSIYFVMWTKIG